MRTIIEVPDDIIHSLDRLCKNKKSSRAAIIREAITQYLQQKSLPAAQDAFGLWKNHLVEGVKYQRNLRNEWSE